MKKLFLTYGLILFTLLAWAQQEPQATGIPYSCSFEEGEDLSAWVMNYKTPLATDKWMVGTLVHSEGQRSLYISSDSKNPVYGAQPNIVASYLRFKFPTANNQQNYDISFDWKGIGHPEDGCLYVMVCPEQMLTAAGNTNYYNLDKIVSSTSGTISPNVVNNACQQFGPTGIRYLCGGEQWQNVTLTNEVKVSSNNSRVPFAIVFIWVNNNRDADLRQTGICIDNLQIGTAQIKKPKNVQVESVCEDSSLLVSWESGSTEFEVQYRKVGTDTWRRQDGITDGVDGFTRNGMQCSYVLQRIREATYDVRVCGIARVQDGTNIVSNYAYKNQVLVYCPENHCVAYLDLHSPNVVCTYGYEWGHNGETPYTHIGVIDHGPDAEESRHTIHVDPTETDARTLGELHTVPPGALGSVRLGNWDDDWEAESITYDIFVDAENQGILIVQYAVVLEDPSHTGEPGFSMVVLDDQGNEVDENCGKANFYYSDAVDADWNMTKENPTGFQQIAWKDWTTIGVNLQPYAGKHIKVRFTTWDCSAGGHCGYAYFTLDCASAHLETENCGNDSKIECFAPEGFTYAWYRGNPEEPGNQPFWFDRELIADPGRQEYTCRVSFIEDPTCYFEVSTISAPRFPVPEFTALPIYSECTSKLKFRNTSHVMNKYDGEENHTNEATNDCHWYFTRLSDGVTTESYNWNPVYTCLPTGDTIIATCRTYIGVNNACDSARTDTIITPNIIPESTEFTMTTCPESPVNFGGEWFNTDTTFVGTYPNFAGCDSTSTLHLKVWPTIPDTYRHDSICSDDHVTINGVRYNQPIENQKITLKTPHGCDSVLYFTLTVNERLKAEIDSFPYACADEEQMFIMFDLIAGVFDSLEIRFDTPELRDTVIYDQVTTIAIPYSADILPGHYTATMTFYQFCCGTYTETRHFDIRYRSSIVEQKWNDVLTLLSPKYNGGFEFLSIQWYKNDEPLLGETHSYLYQPLDMNAEYYAELMREDSVIVKTCPIQPVYHEQQTAYPTIVTTGQHLPMYMEYAATIWYYTISGQLISTFALPQGYTSLVAPQQQGVYIIKSVNTQGETQAQVMIVE